MISLARYVSCDECGVPATIVTGDSAEARRTAAAEDGFARVGRRDLCVNCRPPRPCPACGSATVFSGSEGLGAWWFCPVCDGRSVTEQSNG